MPRLVEIDEVEEHPLDTNMLANGVEPPDDTLHFSGYANLQGPSGFLAIDADSICNSEGAVKDFIRRYRNGNGTVAKVYYTVRIVGVVGQQEPYNPPVDNTERKLQAGGSKSSSQRKPKAMPLLCERVEKG